MAGRLNGKVALITGGAGGCGLAASELFAAEGARVGIVDLPGSKGAEVARRLRDAGYQAIFAAADVSDAQQVKAAVAAVEEAFGHITVLMNHAGILSAMPFLETSEEEWDRIMAVNVKSMFLVTGAVLPGMLAAGGGSIVCTSSISQWWARRWRCCIAPARVPPICSPGLSLWSFATEAFAPMPSARLHRHRPRPARDRYVVQTWRGRQRTGHRCRPGALVPTLGSRQRSLVPGQ